MAAGIAGVHWRYCRQALHASNAGMAGKHYRIALHALQAGIACRYCSHIAGRN
jgi:hypothetical protein